MNKTRRWHQDSRRRRTDSRGNRIQWVRFVQMQARSLTVAEEVAKVILHRVMLRRAWAHVKMQTKYRRRRGCRQLLKIRNRSIEEWTTRSPWTRPCSWYHAAGSVVAGATSRLILGRLDSSETRIELTVLALRQKVTQRDVTARSCAAELQISTKRATSQPLAMLCPTIRRPMDRISLRWGKWCQLGMLWPRTESLLVIIFFALLTAVCLRAWEKP